jgi:hypothetical protein
MDLETLSAMARILNERAVRTGEHSAIFLSREYFEQVKREIIRKGVEHVHTVDDLFILDKMEVLGVLVGWSCALVPNQIVTAELGIIGK